MNVDSTEQPPPFTDTAPPVQEVSARPTRWVGWAPRQPAEPARSKTVPPILALFLYYLVIALFVYQDCINIGTQKNGEEREVVAAFGLLPHADIALLLALGFVICFDRSFRALLASKWSIALVVFLVAYSMLGLLLGNETKWLRVDLRIWGWLFGGLALFRTLMNLQRPSLHILSTCLIAGVILYLSAASGRDQMNAQQAVSNERLWDVNVFNYAGMMLPLLGLVFGLLPVRSILGFLGALLAFGLFFYGGIIVGATRSLAFAVLAVCLSSAAGLLFERTRTQITAKLSPRATWIGLCMLGAGFAVVATLTGVAFSDSTILADRFSSNGDINSGFDRIVELQDALRQIGPFKAVVGGGLGYTFDSIFDYTSIGTHLAVFTFLLKFGIVPFVVMTLSLYVYLPVRFVLAVLNHPSVSPSVRTGLLIVMPGVFAWLAILATSGGYDVYYSLGIGLSVGAFAEIKDRGLLQICR